MVVIENVTKIVSLCDQMGDDYLTVDKDSWKYAILGDSQSTVKEEEKEASQYFPGKKDELSYFQEDDWYIHINLNATVETPHYVKRLLEVFYNHKDEEGNEESRS